MVSPNKLLKRAKKAVKTAEHAAKNVTKTVEDAAKKLIKNIDNALPGHREDFRRRVIEKREIIAESTKKVGDQVHAKVAKLLSNEQLRNEVAKFKEFINLTKWRVIEASRKIANGTLADKNEFLFLITVLFTVMAITMLFLYILKICFSTIFGGRPQSTTKIYDTPLECPNRVILTGPSCGKTRYFYALHDGIDENRIKTVKSTEINIGFMYENKAVCVVDVPSDARIMGDSTTKKIMAEDKAVKHMVYVVFASGKHTTVGDQDVIRLQGIADLTKKVSKKTAIILYYVVDDSIDSISDKPNTEDAIFNNVEELRNVFTDLKVVYKKELIESLIQHFK